MVGRKTSLADINLVPFIDESLQSVMSKHRKQIPLWRKPKTVVIAALTSGLLVGGVVTVLPSSDSTAGVQSTANSVNNASPSPTVTPTPEIKTGDVTPVSNPVPRANAVELTEQALSPVDLPASNLVESDDASTVTAAQEEYIATALDYEQSRRNAKRLTNESVKRQEEATLLTAEWEEAVKEADRLAVIAEEKREEMGKWAATVYRRGMITDDTVIMTMIAGPESTDDLMDMQHYMGSISRSRGNAEREAKESQEAADEARDQAAQTKADADAAAEEAVSLASQAKEAEANSAVLSTQADKQASELARKINVEEINSGTFSPISASQRVLNTSAVGYWNSYLNDLDAAGVVLPSAEELRDPTAYLPEGLVPVLGVDGDVLNGIATHEESGLTILPQETITKVSDSLETVGVSYGTEHTAAQSCEVMVGSLYGNPSADLATLWTSGEQQKDMLDTMPGDVVYSADSESGITQAGVYLGADLVVRASAASGYSEVAKVDDSLLGSNRPSVPATEGEVTPAPAPQEGAVKWECGGIEGATGSNADSAWTLPVATGSYELGVKFEESSHRWGKNVESPGIEFLAKAGTPVMATGNGLVTVTENDPLWGNSVSVKHTDGLTSYYSNLDKVTVEDGSNVKAGTTLGLVGQTGTSANAEQPSVFVQIAFDEIRVDPQVLFFSSSSMGSNDIIGMVPTADGGSVEVNSAGHKNGMLPDEVLCSINAGGHRLRCDAARAYVVLAAAYKAHFGTDLAITDSYRTYEGQVSTKANKPDLATTPGKSKHGWGLAVDLGGGIETFNSVQHEWMKANAEKYGFWHPDWAKSNGSKPEAWHWEYVATQSQYN